jgi:hypothetical protein
MEVVDLVCGDRRSLEYSESSVREDGLVRLARSPILTRHVAVVGGGSAPGESLAFIIRTHAVEAIAARKLAFKVIDAREFDIRHGSLIVIAVLVEPWNRVWTRAAVGRFVILRDRRSTELWCGLSIHPRTR